MKVYRGIITLGLLCSLFTTQSFAADQVAKEESTPPTAEGPLSTDSIPPITPEPPATTTAAPVAQQMPPAHADSTQIAPPPLTPAAAE